ncbi:MAG: hypothetical protein DMF53_05670 [Acidobacteria bacterium]|nr:MAG: hypothetical protein DMF53_05670 [Acidobacteriota bacterium]
MEQQITGVDDPIRIASCSKRIELGQCTVPDLRRLSCEKRGGITEELASVVDDAIVIAVHAKEGIIPSSLGPCDVVQHAVSIDIEADGRIGSGQMEAVLREIEEHRAVVLENMRRRLVEIGDAL